MKFTIIGPIYPYRGGISHYTYHLDRALHHAGHETQVISFSRQYPRWLYPGVSDKDPSQVPLQSKATFTLDPFYPWTWTKSITQITSWKPDLVIIQWWTPFWGLPFAIISDRLNKNGLFTLYLIHNVLPHEQSPLDRGLAKMALSRGEAFIAQTEPQKERLISLIPDASVQICEHPTYTQFTSNQQSQLQARRTLGLPVQATILLFFGIVRPYKGLSVVLEALHRLKNEGIEPFLVVAGEFWEDLSAYESRIANLGLSDQIHIENRYIPNEEVDTYFSAADVLLAPYTGGTQSGVVSLGFGFGIPMIVSEKAAEGIKRSDFTNLRIVPNGDSESLAKAIRNFIDNPLPSRIGASSVEKDWGRLVSVLENFVNR
jgi:glycosyltransferase involved in cell wall biosynthesis